MKTKRIIKSVLRAPMAACAGAVVVAMSFTAPVQADEAADFDDDGFVDAADLAFLLAAWGPWELAAHPADLNNDRMVDAADLAILLSSFGLAGDLEIGPVEGITTDWHIAPTQTGIPVGMVVDLRIPVPINVTVIWQGAVEIMRDDEHSIARCPLTRTGPQTASVEIFNGVSGDSLSIQFDVMEITAQDIAVSTIEVLYVPLEIDETLPEDELNALTMAYFFSGDSIAAITEVDEDSYLTSVRRDVSMQATVIPAALGPLMEWRIDGQPALALGEAGLARFNNVGMHAVAVGPPVSESSIELEMYNVTITSHEGGIDIIPEGEPVLFEAATDPPGYENEITWLASTKYGTGLPVLGYGPTFLVEFNDTWGLDENGDLFQWLGVKGDTALFNQDDCNADEDCPEDGDICTIARCVDGRCEQVNIVFSATELSLLASHGIEPPCGDGSDQCCTGLRDNWVSQCDGDTFFRFDLAPLPADFFGPGSAPFAEIVFFGGEAIGDPDCPEADTIIQRSAAPFVPCDPPGGPPVVIDIEIVALSLVSCEPIEIDFPGGPVLWDVKIDLSVVPPPPGQMTVTKTHCNGGTFESELPVQPRFTFTEVGNPGNFLVFDTGLFGFPPEILFSAEPTPWMHGIANGHPQCDFIPGVQDPDPTQDCDLPNEDPEVSCNDGIDNDCDGVIDEEDPDCR